jgi:hypothetical protein
LRPDQRQALDARVVAAFAGSDLEPGVRERSERALLWKELREVVGMPRLELGFDAN